MVLSGKDIGGFPRRAVVMTIVEIYRYIYVLDESLMGRWIRINENEEGNIGRKWKQESLTCYVSTLGVV